MALLEIILLIVLVIPLFAIFTDSPLGRAVARRLEGRSATPSELGELLRRIEALEGELSELSAQLEPLKEANQFYQRLLEEGKGRTPPPAQPPSH